MEIEQHTNGVKLKYLRVAKNVAQILLRPLRGMHVGQENKPRLALVSAGLFVAPLFILNSGCEQVDTEFDSPDSGDEAAENSEQEMRLHHQSNDMRVYRQGQTGSSRDLSSRDLSSRDLQSQAEPNPRMRDKGMHVYPGSNPTGLNPNAPGRDMTSQASLRSGNQVTPGEIRVRRLSVAPASRVWPEAPRSLQASPPVVKRQKRTKSVSARPGGPRSSGQPTSRRSTSATQAKSSTASSSAPNTATTPSEDLTSYDKLVHKAAKRAATSSERRSKPRKKDPIGNSYRPTIVSPGVGSYGGLNSDGM